MKLIAPFAPERYRRCVVLGLAAGLALACALAWASGLKLSVLLAASAASCAVYGVGALARKVFTGEERLVRYHGEWTAFGTTAALLWAAGQPMLAYLDGMAAGLACLFAFGRFGCHAAGCCHGRPARHGVVYSDAHVRDGVPGALAGVRLWPVQLMESGVAALLAVWCARLALQGPTGQAFAAYLVAYGVVRFGLEFVRGDERPICKGLSEAQLTAAANITLVVLCGLARPWHVAAWFAVASAIAWMFARRVLIVGGRHAL